MRSRFQEGGRATGVHTWGGAVFNRIRKASTITQYSTTQLSGVLILMRWYSYWQREASSPKWKHGWLDGWEVGATRRLCVIVGRGLWAGLGWISTEPVSPLDRAGARVTFFRDLVGCRALRYSRTAA